MKKIIAKPEVIRHFMYSQVTSRGKKIHFFASIYLDIFECLEDHTLLHNKMKKVKIHQSVYTSANAYFRLKTNKNFKKLFVSV